jgi:hypothetical protein
MKTHLTLTATLIITAALLTPHCLADNYTTSYQLLNHTNSTTHYRLNVIVPQSLYEYYTAKTHTLTTGNDFDKFVTPYALQPIADSLKQIYTDDEDLTNGALMIVHQIPYEQTVPPKYPAETIANNKGDCDLFSFVAASITKAAGLDTVLLYYEREEHMNIAVNLPHAPQDTRGNAVFVTNNNVRYYMAECTGDNWQEGWRIGECPDELRQATPQVITLDNYERSATGQVSASYNTLEPATLTLTTSTAFIIQGSTITLSGQLTPNLQDKNVTIYIRINTSPWQVLNTVTTDSSGHFDYTWNVENGGVYNVRASWSGDENYAVADSPVRTITSLSTFFMLLLVVMIILVVVGVAAYFMTRHTQQPFPEPEPPEIPS